MSGGVLSEYGTYTFVKVRPDGEERSYWYVCEFDVVEGDRVLFPKGAGGVGTGTVERVEFNVSGQVAPIPIKRAKALIKKL